MDKTYLKYLKYKQKYLELKNKVGGTPKINKEQNTSNVLIMGAGPTGLITALALLKRHGTNKIKANNILLVEQQNYWRPQIFFLQNSFREYDSIDYIRDIDIKLYQKLERVGCYIGSPPSTKYPYCINQSKTEITNEDDIPPQDLTNLSMNNTKIRAPSNIPNVKFEDLSDDEK